MRPRGHISSIRQVQRPDLLRFAAFFSTAAIHAATEFWFAQTSERARVLAEVSTFLWLSPPGVSHVTAIVAFIGDLTALHPTAHPSDKDEEDEVPDDDVELLIVQAWRTDTEGELLGILFGKVRDGHLEPITSEVLVFLAQLVHDLPLEILSCCNERSTPTALPRTLAPQLLWSTCTKLDSDNIYLPSTGDYLVIDVTDITLWDPVIRRVEVGTGEEEEEREEEEEEREGTNEEEEDSEAGSNDPDNRESEETGSEGSGSEESGGSDEQSEEEDEAVAQRRRKKVEGKHPVQESDKPGERLLQDDPALNPELPQEESGGDGVATARDTSTQFSDIPLATETEIAVAPLVTERRWSSLSRNNSKDNDGAAAGAGAGAGAGASTAPSASGYGHLNERRRSSFRASSPRVEGVATSTSSRGGSSGQIEAWSDRASGSTSARGSIRGGSIDISSVCLRSEESQKLWKQGWLMQEGRGSRGWERRFFVLQGPLLCCYSSDNLRHFK
ncbi:hypothetical protein CBR_g49628 [Chara braunii]|nr:hypothetical protein CBR_g49628 [Chara braunii]|eukprot:GBG89776.1 hypothetical protein CBR_g49628 [Chara braunii]